ncbi:AraC family transcriptional regulator [uncultured Sphaerochaeta sp.]|uniref:AraC family transcriptional regulator n=1 Tax=uncultured Sphaerochaeta sp. TaxID=886478 RepID=UPI002A0A17AC|nr:AraC family transcriptional regulator [uncultured Sphaerochaeta sp.]
MNKSFIEELIEDAHIEFRAYSFSEHEKGDSLTRQISDFDILYTISGEYSLEIEGKKYISKSNDVMILPPGCLMKLTSNTHCRQFYCHFVLVTHTSNSSFTCRFKNYQVPEKCKNIITYYKEAFTESMDQKVPLSSSIGLTIKLLILALINSDSDNLLFFSDTENDVPDGIFRAIDYIHQHFEEPISIEQLAKYAGYNTSYFSRYFKAKMGISPLAYISNYKMKFAQYLILNTDKSLKEIASNLGFPDQFTFSKKFKSNCKMSPSDFRKIGF